MPHNPFAQRGTLSVSRIMIAVALIACSIVLTSCGGYTAKMQTPDGANTWLRWTPSDGDWGTVNVNVYCPTGMAYCNEAGLAFSEWDNESVHELLRYNETSKTAWESHMSWSDVEYEIRDIGPNGWGGLAYLTNCYAGATAGCRDAWAATNLHPGYVEYVSPYERQAVACQEIGHILGLGHANGDCMGKGYEAILGDNTSKYLEPHSTNYVADLRWWHAVCAC